MTMMMVYGVKNMANSMCIQQYKEAQNISIYKIENETLKRNNISV